MNLLVINEKLGTLKVLTDLLRLTKKPPVLSVGEFSYVNATWACAQLAVEIDELCDPDLGEISKAVTCYMFELIKDLEIMESMDICRMPDAKQLAENLWVMYQDARKAVSIGRPDAVDAMADLKHWWPLNQAGLSTRRYNCILKFLNEVTQ
jgi:hypothetical protein